MTTNRDSQAASRSLKSVANVLLVVATLLFAHSGSVVAQQAAAIQGAITDEQGAKIVGAEVRLRSRDGLQLFSRSGREGAFAFAALEPGKYFVEVKAPGFSSLTTEE